MDIGALLEPWIILLFLVIPLVYAERWIHQHIYGVGYLLTKEKEKATTFYYLIFFPGVFIHEFIQYLAAGALNVKVKKLTTRPHKQDNGTIRYDFVTIDKTDRLRASIIGGLPFIIGSILVWTISTSILDLHLLTEAFATADLPTILDAIERLLNTPDFWLWLYILFAVSNGMLPTKEDRQGWSFIVFAIGGASIFLMVLGLDVVIVNTLEGPVTDGLNMVNTALLIILLVDVFGIFVLGLIEDGLERYRGEHMDYSGDGKSAKRNKDSKREPGSNLPLARGEPLPSIYNMTLPLPELPRRGTMPRSTPVAPVSKPVDEEAKPIGAPTPPRRQEPAVAASTARPPSAPVAPTIEHAPDPDAAARAQRDPRIPRTGDSPFKRTTLPVGEEGESAETTTAETPQVAASTQSPVETRRPSTFTGRRVEETDSGPKPVEDTSAGRTPFGSRPASSSGEDKTDEPAPPARRFGASAPAASTEGESPSRFGSRPSAPPSTDKDAPAGRTPSGSRPASSSDDKTDEPAPPARRFGANAPAASTEGESPSRFGSRPSAPPSTDKDAPAGRSTPFGSRPASSSGEGKTDEPAPPARRFGASAPAASTEGESSSRFGSRPSAPPSTERRVNPDETQVTSGTQRLSTPSKQPDSDAPSSSRFGGRPKSDEAKPSDEGRLARPSGRSFNPDETQVTSGTQRLSVPPSEPLSPAKPSGRFSRDESSGGDTQARSPFNRRPAPQSAEESTISDSSTRRPASASADVPSAEELQPARPSGLFRRQQEPPQANQARRFGRPAPLPTQSSDDEPPPDDGGADDVEYVDFDDV